MPRPQPTSREIFFGEEDLIVSKTDLHGKITYANSMFVRVSGYSEAELLGAPHSILRHPDMPRCVFKHLWDTIESGSEIFAFVKNLAKSGDFYWVFAHVTPSFDEYGKIVGYHSNRRCPDRQAVASIEPLYKHLLDIEARNSDARKGMEDSYQALIGALKGKAMSYDQFVFSL